MRLKSLAQAKSLKGKRVLLRLDLNVTLEKGRIATGGDSRIRAVAPTVKLLQIKGAKVIIVAHLGRPRHRDPELSLAPVARRFATVLGDGVRFIPDSLDDDALVDRKLAMMKDGEVAMLENIRYYKGEEDDSPFLARRLASFADVYVNDAFSVSHRKAASVVGITKLLPSFAGPVLEREIAALSKVLEKPKKPMVVLMGGAKVSDKIHVIENMAKVAQTVLIGGKMANAFLLAKGLSIGASTADPEDVRLARRLMRKPNILLPVDVVVSKSLDGKKDAIARAVGDVRKGEIIADVGPETVRLWSTHIKKAKTLVWNGPLGLFEVRKFSHGSLALGRLIAASSSGKAFGVVGGGETVSCLERTGMAEYVDHVSTGGGAMLDFLGGKSLPGLLPLRKR